MISSNYDALKNIALNYDINIAGVEKANIMDDGELITLEVKHPDLLVRIHDEYYGRYERIFKKYIIDIKNKCNEKIGELTFYKSIKLSDYRCIRPRRHEYMYHYSNLFSYTGYSDLLSFTPITHRITSMLDEDLNIEYLVLLYKVELIKEYRGKKILPYIMDTLFNNFITDKSLVILEAISLSKMKRSPEYQQKQTAKLIKYYKSIFNNIQRIDDSDFLYMIKDRPNRAVCKY